MCKKFLYSKVRVYALLVFMSFICLQTNLRAQSDTITFFQYRYVPPENAEEFIKRETTYWSEIARKAMEKGNILFWGLYQKVGGYDMPNEPNFMFINAYANIDAVDEVWNPEEVFPGKNVSEMETQSLSTTLHSIFLSTMNWEQKEGVVPPEDFKYVKMVYHSSSAPLDYVNLEKQHWAPFIKKVMDEGKTKQKAWGNAIVLSPRGPNIKYNSVSYDLYATLNDALIGWIDDSAEIPDELFDKLTEIQIDRRLEYVYEVVKVVTPEMEQ